MSYLAVAALLLPLVCITWTYFCDRRGSKRSSTYYRDRYGR